MVSSNFHLVHKPNIEKVPIDAIQGDLEELGLDRSVVEKLLSVLTNNSIEAIADVLGPESEAVKQLSKLLSFFGSLSNKFRKIEV